MSHYLNPPLAEACHRCAGAPRVSPGVLCTLCTTSTTPRHRKD